MTELKPCPFCGGEASIYHGDSTDGYIKGTDYVLAFCGWCGASIREKKEDDVIKKWNTRPNPWHTGIPLEDGWYLFLFRTISNSLVPVTRTLKEMKDLIVTNPKAFFDCFPYWQKIEIVKENEDGRTD